MTTSPDLQAKKARRAEKERQLRAMMETSLTPQSKAAASEYVSYQHDVEQGGHVVLLDDPSGEPITLKEQMNSLIHVEDEGEQAITTLSQKQKAFITALLLFFLYMWL